MDTAKSGKAQDIPEKWTEKVGERVRDPKQWTLPKRVKV